MSGAAITEENAKLQLHPPPLLEIGDGIDTPVFCVSFTEESTWRNIKLSIYSVSIVSRSILPHVSYTIQYLDISYAATSYESDVHADRLFPLGWSPSESTPFDSQPAVKAKFAHCRRTPGVLPEWGICRKYPPEIAPTRGMGALMDAFIGRPELCLCRRDFFVPAALQKLLDSHGLTLQMSSRENFGAMEHIVKKLLDRFDLSESGVGQCHVFHLFTPRHQQSARLSGYSATLILRHGPLTIQTPQRVFQILCLDGGSMMCSALLCILEGLTSLIFPSSTTLVFPVESKYEEFARTFGFKTISELTHPLYAPDGKTPDHWALINKSANMTRGKSISLMFQSIDCLAYRNLLSDLGSDGDLATVLVPYLKSEDCDPSDDGTKPFGLKKFLLLKKQLTEVRPAKKRKPSLSVIPVESSSDSEEGGPDAWSKWEPSRHR